MRRYLMGAALAAMALGNVGTAAAQTATGIGANQSALGLAGARAGAKVTNSNQAVGALLPIALAALSAVVTVAVIVEANNDNEDDRDLTPVSP